MDDVETMLAISATYPESAYTIDNRFAFEHLPQFDGVRDDPRFQAFMDKFPSFYVPASE